MPVLSQRRSLPPTRITAPGSNGVPPSSLTIWSSIVKRRVAPLGLLAQGGDEFPLGVKLAFMGLPFFSLAPSLGWGTAPGKCSTDSDQLAATRRALYI